jgi:transcriptional regulator GlxA family with amidase domain
MTRTLAVFVFPGFQVPDLAVLTVFDLANAQPGGPFYESRIVSHAGGIVRGSAGASLESQSWRDTGSADDTVLIVGSGQASPVERDAVSALRRARVYRSAGGMVASIGMALTIVEQDLGADMASAVAREMGMVQWRSAAAAASSSLLQTRANSGRIQAALAYARQHLHKPLTIDALADRAHMSRRHFTRAFRAETGQSPARAIEMMRAEAARMLLEGSALPLNAVARDAGFTSSEQMRGALIRVYDETPQSLRRHVADGRTSSLTSSCRRSA